MHFASSCNNSEVLEYLLEHGEMGKSQFTNAKNYEKGETPFLVAVRKGKFECMK